MARKTKQDAAKAKAAKQKKMAIVGGVLLVALLAIQGPKTLKMLHPKPLPPLNAPVAATTPTTPTVTPSDPNSLAAPTLGGAPTAAPAPADTSSLVDAVPVSPDPGQLETFQKFASKDPFQSQVSAAGAGGSSKSPASTGKSTTPIATTPSAASSPPSSSSSSPPSSSPPAPAPTSAIISLNGEVMSVTVGGDFPTAGATFLRDGSLFHVVSLTAKTAKVAIVGGSYADGAPAITLKMGTPLTLQNTADGTKYILILKPPTTPLSGVASTVAGAPTSTTSAVPSGSG